MNVVIQGIKRAGPETVRYAPSSVMDVVAAGIVNRALYKAIVQPSLPTAANAIVEAVLASPDVEIPAGTGTRTSWPTVLGVVSSMPMVGLSHLCRTTDVHHSSYYIRERRIHHPAGRALSFRRMIP